MISSTLRQNWRALLLASALALLPGIAAAQTGTVRGRARFANPDGAFTPGIFARLRLPGSAGYEVLLLPDSAIGNDQSRRVVFVVGEGNRVSMREVHLGRLIEGLRVIR